MAPDLEKSGLWSESSGEYEATKIEKHFSVKSVFSNFVDSFKPACVEDGIEGLTEREAAMRQLEIRNKKANLKKRHTQMASIAGCVGTGLFIGSGNSLKSGGPAALIIGFGLMAIAVVCFVCALGELSVRYKAPAYTHFITRFIGPSWGFAASWAYLACWLIMTPLELIAAAMTVEYWRETGTSAASQVNPIAWVALFYGTIVILSFWGVRGYGEVEFVLSFIKVVATVGFIIFAIVVTCGGGPSRHYFGGTYYHTPGAFAHGFKGVVVAFLNSAFAYGGTEVAGLAAAKTANPHITFPSAIKQVFWRIVIFFFVSIVLIGCLVPYDHPLLGTGSTGTASPFVIAIKNSGVRGLPSVFNAVIMLSVFSVANAAVFAGPQVMVSLAYEGHAPRICGYIDRSGRPLVAMGISLLVGLLCFLAGYKNYNVVFNWLYAFVSLSFLFTWFSIFVAHIRHRLAMRAQGVPLSDLLYKDPFGIPGSIVGGTIVGLVICFQFWIGLFPLGAKPDPQIFFQNWLSVPVVLAVFLVHMLVTRSKFISQKDIDITSDLIPYDMNKVEAENESHEKRKKSNLLYRIACFWC